jgi:hypothetical protein
MKRNITTFFAGRIRLYTVFASIIHSLTNYKLLNYIGQISQELSNKINKMSSILALWTQVVWKRYDGMNTGCEKNLPDSGTFDKRASSLWTEHAHEKNV